MHNKEDVLKVEQIDATDVKPRLIKERETYIKRVDDAYKVD